MNVNSPVLVWIAVAVLAIVAVIAGAERISGAYFKFIRAFTDGQRRTSRESDDAAIDALRQEMTTMREANTRELAALRESNARMEAELAEVRVYQRSHDAVLRMHAVWDRRALAAAPDVLEDPPPLWPLLPGVAS